MKRSIIIALLAAFITSGAFARERGVSRSAILRFEPAAVGDAPIWPMGGVHIRTALAAARFLGAPAITEPWRASWRITWYSRDDIPSLMTNTGWLAADPRYANGAYQTRVWLQRFHPATTHSSSAYYGYWCEMSALSIPAALGTSQTHPLVLPSNIGMDDHISVEGRLGLGHWIEVNVVPGGPWYKVGGGILGEHGRGVPSPVNVFTIGEPSYLRCD